MGWAQLCWTPPPWRLYRYPWESFTASAAPNRTPWWPFDWGESCIRVASLSQIYRPESICSVSFAMPWTVNPTGHEGGISNSNTLSLCSSKVWRTTLTIFDPIMVRTVARTIIHRVFIYYYPSYYHVCWQNWWHMMTSWRHYMYLDATRIEQLRLPVVDVVIIRGITNAALCRVRSANVWNQQTKVKNITFALNNSISEKYDDPS